MAYFTLLYFKGVYCTVYRCVLLSNWLLPAASWRRHSAATSRRP